MHALSCAIHVLCMMQLVFAWTPACCVRETAGPMWEPARCWGEGSQLGEWVWELTVCACGYGACELLRNCWQCGDDTALIHIIDSSIPHRLYYVIYQVSPLADIRLY